MNVVIQNYTRVDVCSYNETNIFFEEGRINSKYNYFGNGNLLSYAFHQ